MPRYFIELSYKGHHYAGFQVQDNAVSVQGEVEKALKTFYRKDFALTGSSRTDAGVHALQNFFHFDEQGDLGQLDNAIYHLNAILPGDIVLKKIRLVGNEAHCRFDATSREYAYYLYAHKDPFLEDRAYFYPYKLDIKALNEAAAVLTAFEDFSSFSKRNSQVKSFICRLLESRWEEAEDGLLVYRVQGNRFLRGMVRGLVGTMLLVGRGRMNTGAFKSLVSAKDASQARFDVPPHGLFLERVNFPKEIY